MPTVNPNRYPLDYTGTASTNKIAGESVTTTTRKIRVFIPSAAPYFVSSMRIVDAADGKVLNDTQWKPYYVVQAATALAGQGQVVCVAVAVIDQAVSNNLTIDYQTVGSDYVTGYDSILQLLNAVLVDDRPVTYPNVLDAPSAYATGAHLHTTNGTLGWEYLITMLEQLKMTMLLGDTVNKDAVLKYIDTVLAGSNAVTASELSPTSSFGQHVNATNNPHNVTKAQLGLSSVQNYGLATLLDIASSTPPNNLYVTADVVSAAVQNAVNLGMDAHILRTDNPHGVTKSQIGLGNLLNYGVATLAELQSPNPATPKYITNVVLGDYLNAYFANQSTTISTTLGAINTNINATATATASANAQYQTLQASITQSLQLSQSAVGQAQAALDVANQNALNITASVETAEAHVENYLRQAVTAAYNSGYSAGYRDGQRSI